MIILFSVLTTLILFGAKAFIPNSDWPSYIIALPFALLATYYMISSFTYRFFYLVLRFNKQDQFPMKPRISLPNRIVADRERLINRSFQGETEIIDITNLLNRRKSPERGTDNDPA